MASEVRVFSFLCAIHDFFLLWIHSNWAFPSLACSQCYKTNENDIIYFKCFILNLSKLQIWMSLR